MTVAERIRRAALGPTPRHARRSVRSDWIDWSALMAAGETLGKHWCASEFWESTSILEKRFFLLFVAEALGQMDLKSI